MPEQHPRRAMPDPAEVERFWLDAYPPGVPGTYDYPEVPLTRFLDDAAKDFPETEAVHFLGYSLTYRRLLDKVDRFASALEGLGVGRGDRVGLVLPNCPQHVIALFAVLRLGAIASEHRSEAAADDLGAELHDAGCRVVVCLDAGYERLASLKGKLPTVEHIVATGRQDALPFPRNQLHWLTGRRDGSHVRIPEAEGVLWMADLIARSAPTALQVPVDAATDVAVLLYTSSATRGKAVMLTHRNLVANAFQARLWIPDILAGREHVLCALPFSSAYGLTLALSLGVLAAATLTLLPTFDATTVLKTIERRKPTLFPGVPTMYIALAAAGLDGRDLRSIRACLSGGAPLPAEVARAFEAATGGKLREGYGMAEAAPLTHANPIYGKAKRGSVGLPVSDTVCALRDPDDPLRPAAPDQPGELAIAGPQVMAGYWNRPEATAEVLVDGWLLTGDIAEIDEDGYVAIVDRKDDLIIAEGRAISPRAVEAALSRHPEVERAVVAGVPDPYRGEAVKAYLVLTEGSTATHEEIDAFLRGALEVHALPTAYEVRPRLPDALHGRSLRRSLVEEELRRRRSS